MKHLFAICGVVSLLISPAFATLGKTKAVRAGGTLMIAVMIAATAAATVPTTASTGSSIEGPARSNASGSATASTKKRLNVKAIGEQRSGGDMFLGTIPCRPC
jgi:hypothetical protein